MPDYTQEFTTIPYGPLGIIALPGCEELAQKIDRYLVKWRAQKQSEHKNSLSFAGYERDTYSRDSARAKARARFTSPFAVTIFLLYAICSTTA